MAVVGSLPTALRLPVQLDSVTLGTSVSRAAFDSLHHESRFVWKARKCPWQRHDQQPGGDNRKKSFGFLMINTSVIPLPFLT